MSGGTKLATRKHIDTQYSLQKNGNRACKRGGSIAQLFRSTTLHYVLQSEVMPARWQRCLERNFTRNSRRHAERAHVEIEHEKAKSVTKM